MASTFAKLAIYVFTFLGVFALLFGFIDGRFFLVSYSANAGYDPEIAERFSLANVTMYANTGNDNMTYAYSSYHDNSPHEWSAGLPSGQYLEVWWSNPVYVPPFVRILEFRHIEKVWWGLQIHDRFSFKGAKSGVEYPDERLTEYNLLDEYDSATNGSSFYAECAHIPVSVIFEYNQTKYSDIEDAWDNDEISYTLSYEVDWNATQVSALTILGKLLTFQSPDLGITGDGGLILNGLIAIPFIIMVIVLIILLVQSVIPFIRGL